MLSLKSSQFTILIQDKPATVRSQETKLSILVAWELRDYNKMIEKAGIKTIDFGDFVFCTTESKSIVLMPAFS